jgi:predicted  nucleic acid-binding Zn-ribbon protein
VLQLLTELLTYARKLLPLMEIYAARRSSAPVRDPATHEFQTYAAELLRASRSDLMDLRSALEALNQRLRVIDDQAVALQREVAQAADRQRIMVIAIALACVSSLGTLILCIVMVSRR